MEENRTLVSTRLLRTIVDLQPGDHLCCIYETEEEHQAVLTPFLRQGLERGEKLVYIVAAHTAENILGYLRDGGLETEGYLASGQLTILTHDEAYMREGVFDPEGMIALLKSETEQALAEGYPALRVTGEMTWALRGLPGSERLIEYEAKLNDFFPGSNCLAICQYDRRRFDPAILLDVLCTHPNVVVGTAVYDNFYYIPPAEFPLHDLPEARLRYWLANLAERNQVKKLLQESEEKYRHLVERANDGITIIQDTIVKYANPRLAEMWGGTVQEVIGTPFTNYVHPDEIPKVVDRYKRRMAGEDVPPIYKTVLRREDGSKVYAELNAAIINYQGKPADLVIVRDITERKRAEEALRESQQLLKRTFASLRDAVFVIAAETVEIMDCNPAASEIFGYSREEMLGRTTTFLHVDEAALEEFRGHLYPAIEEKGFLSQLEFRMKRKDGTVFPTEHSVMPLEDEDGKRIGWLSVVCDITERKQAEEEKERLQAQLLQSQKMEAIGILASGIAHDFNNLLAAIQGYTELAMERVDKADPLYSDLERIGFAAERGASLTRQLLLFCRKQPLEPRPLNINKMVISLSEMLDRLISEDIAIEIDLEPELWTVHADEASIEQLIMNLAVNAKEAMPKGGKLAIKTENVALDEEKCKAIPEARPGDFVCLSVVDTGVGMDEEIMQHIFEPFFTTKEVGEGVGLGLSVVYGVVKEHEGWINVYSEPGKGSTFQVFLPALP